MHTPDSGIAQAALEHLSRPAAIYEVSEQGPARLVFANQRARVLEPALPAELQASTELGAALASGRAGSAALGALTLALRPLPEGRVLVEIYGDDTSELYRQLFDNSSLGKIIYRTVDPTDWRTFVTVHVNQAACDATGMPLYDDIGRPMRDTAPGLATTPLADHFESVAQGKGRRSWEINYSDDRFAPTWFRSTLFRLDADHIALVFDNINEEKRMNAQLEERRRALEQSNAHLEQFAYVASHDLQEPLRTLSSFSELLIERYGEHFDERGQRYLRYIGEASTRMQSLVDGLLRFSRVGRQGKAFASHRLGELVAEAQRAVHHAVVREGATVHLDGPMVAVHVDRDQIISVLQNLLTNALRYRSEASPDIHIGWKVSARRVTLTVSDNGVGVPEHQAERIFLMFQRLHGREVEGTGMGLTLARRIARRHGGDLVLRPTDGPGATFELTLPLPESP